MTKPKVFKQDYVETGIHSAVRLSLAFSPQHVLAFSPSSGLKNIFIKDHRRTISILDSTIEAVGIAKEFVGINVVKGALSGLATLLTTARDTVSNRSDLAAAALYCAQIFFVLLRAMVGKTEKDVSPSVMAAISDLKNTVEDIRKSIIKSSKRNVLNIASRSKSDKEKIAGWKIELDRILGLFRTELQVASNLRLEEICDKLANVSGDVAALLEIRTSCCSGPKDAPPTRGHPPPAPTSFFGRDTLVETTVDYVTKHKPVALIGPGGIGKTSIARAVLHHSSVEEHFGNNTFFIRCDDLVVSYENFLNRIGKVIGVNVSQSDPLSSLRAFFSSSSEPSFLVLDNAETILDTETDRSFIAEFIEELNAYPNISLLLTTRTTVLPNNAGWRSIDVPSLDKDAARQVFYSAYNGEGPPGTQIVDELLDEVDHHPLSINLLASAGAQNRWPIAELHSRWRNQSTKVLDLGDNTDRLRSLAVSIELSLASQMVRKLGDHARHVLHVIAFLPQGVDAKKLQGLFPSVPNIQFITDTLQKMSLTHRNHDFITMLAPVRLHMLHQDPSGLPLLQDVRSFYFRELKQCRDLVPGDEGFSKGTWVVCEDDNLEDLISRSDDSPETREACYDLLYVLYWHKPRKTTLGDKIRGFREDNNESALSKARCLQRAGMVDEVIGRFADALETHTIARTLALAHNDQLLATHILKDLADVIYRSGKLSDAECQYSQALASFRDLTDLMGIARCNKQLGIMMGRQGNFSEASKFLEEALEYFEGIQDKIRIGGTRMNLGVVASDSANQTDAQQHFDVAITFFTDLGDHWSLSTCLTYYAEMELNLGNWTEVHHLLERAECSFMAVHSTHGTANCLVKRGRAYLGQKEYSLAEEYVEQADRIFTELSATGDHALCIFYLASIEQDRHRYQNAISLYTKAKELFIGIGDLTCQARCSAGLGNLAYAEKDFITSETSFRMAKLEYEAAGLSSEKVEKEFGDSEGWQWFEETCLTGGNLD